MKTYLHPSLILMIVLLVCACSPVPSVPTGTPASGPTNKEGQFDFVDDLGGFGGVAVDSLGNVYIADTFNHRIQKFTGEGQFLGQWGSQGTEDGQFQWPEGLVVEPEGNLYVSDPERHNIQKFDSSGTFLLKWGTQGNGELEFREPVSVVVRPDGKIYVADYQNSRIQVFRAVEN